MAEGKDARHYVLVSNKVYHLVVEHLTLAEKPHRLIGKKRSTKGNAMGGNPIHRLFLKNNMREMALIEATVPPRE